MAAIPRTAWRTSSYSGGSEPNCVEVGPGHRVVGIRDTEGRTGGMIVVSRTTWAAFIGSVTTR